MKKIEIWMDVVGFEENYSVSSLGKVKRKESYFIRTDGRIRKFKERLLGGNFNKGYHMVALQKTGDGRKYQVHRIVALSFIPNPNKLPQINHKNGIPSDNRVESLEWCTNEENSRHSREILGKDTGIQNRIKIVCINNGKEYESTIDAAQKLGIPKDNICNVLRGRHHQTYGYKFKYSENAN